MKTHEEKFLLEVTFKKIKGQRKAVVTLKFADDKELEYDFPVSTLYGYLKSLLNSGEVSVTFTEWVEIYGIKDQITTNNGL